MTGMRSFFIYVFILSTILILVALYVSWGAERIEYLMKHSGSFNDNNSIISTIDIPDFISNIQCEENRKQLVFDVDGLMIYVVVTGDLDEAGTILHLYSVDTEMNFKSCRHVIPQNFQDYYVNSDDVIGSF